MLKLVTLLHHQALCITFVNTEFNHKRMLDAEGPMFLSDLPVGLQFVAIPNLLPLLEATLREIMSPCASSPGFLMGAPFCTLVGDLKEMAGSGSGLIPPVSCLMVDGFMTFWPIRPVRSSGSPS
ncbi:7-deoxyloganetin glucosyltransferase-like [Punica granatum]|uniref:7-deoxyloganetin glucosyltransferase-like n=1 Tax=Punica granatum TaxID=22663 RepID=A0A6P8BPS6_PUNGR|nr:7-deoxyloganetin glucosyltransferase-like [Punica granatum]